MHFNDSVTLIGHGRQDLYSKRSSQCIGRVTEVSGDKFKVVWHGYGAHQGYYLFSREELVPA